MRHKKIFTYTLLILFTFIMMSPLLILISNAFKDNQEILSSFSLIPKSFTLEGFINGWKGNGQVSFSTFYLNTFKVVTPTVLCTIVSSLFVAYGFARFQFPFKKTLFIILISTLMLPNAVVMVPRYLLFKNLGWIDSYRVFIVPAAFATKPFFVFMLVQFIRSIPRDLDEAAKIDGCNSFRILTQILVPICKPAIISAGLFELIWSWNDFFNSLVYINSVEKFTLPLGLRMSLDITTQTNWNSVIAMSLVSIIPPTLIFFFLQKHFVEGVSTSGLKG
ncbi:carbohydrate ABC transporter permease [Vallitalea okinawensis]|uniref:carbohydrate ABC transporter permease n=1 Tax=Vallitalea okinawensis TaxID=2078660 RepID=UPI0038CD62E7